MLMRVCIYWHSTFGVIRTGLILNGKCLSYSVDTPDECTLYPNSCKGMFRHIERLKKERSATFF